MRARVAEAVGGVSGGGHKAKSLPISSPGTPHSPAKQQQLLAAEAARLVRVLNTFVEQSPSMAWISGPDTLFSFVNQPWLEFRGRTLEQERGTGWWEGVHPEDRERCHIEYLSAFEGRQPFQLECRLQRADGRYCWLALHGVPQYLLNGRFVGYAGSLRMIQREPAAAAPQPASGSIGAACNEIVASQRPALTPADDPARSVELSPETLLACLEASPTPHLALDGSGSVVYANAALRALAERSLPDHGIPGNLESSPAPFDPDGRVRAWLDSRLVADGFDARFLAHAQRDHREPVFCFAIIDAGAEQRGRFLQSTFLHDLLNAASGVEMVGELLAESSLPEEPTEYVRLLQIAIQRLLSSIHQQRVFLDDSGRMVGEIPARAVLEEVVARQAGSALQRRCSIQIAPGPGDVTVVCDRALLIRVLESMLRCAIEAGSVGDVVTAGYRQTPGQVEFWVHDPSPLPADAGTGSLRRASPATGKSAGSGMQAVRLLSELHLKGSVMFTSSAEHGTTLTVRFPDGSQLR